MTMGQSDNEGRRGGSGGRTSGLRSAASGNPITERLLHSAEDYLGARSEKLVGTLGEKVSGATRPSQANQAAFDDSVLKDGVTLYADFATRVLRS